MVVRTISSSASRLLYNSGVTREEFEAIVSEVLKSMPVEFARQLDNVEFVVEAWPSQNDLQSVGAGTGVILYGLYRGVAKTRRANYSGVLPDKIVIYSGPILAHVGGNPDTVKAQVREIVLHEIGHHFGMREQEIRRAQGVTVL